MEVINPQKHESVLDPACGTAGFLISAWKHILKNNSSLRIADGGQNPKTLKTMPRDQRTPDERARLASSLRGYDISPDMVRLSLANLYLHGFSDPHVVEYDTLTQDDKWNEVADVILANPPFISPKGGIKPHKRFSVPATRSEVLFVDYMADHLTATGRAAIVVPEGIIFQSGTAYKALRKLLVDNSLVAVVSLPAGMFNPYSGVKTSILFYVLASRLQASGASCNRSCAENGLSWLTQKLQSAPPLPRNPTHHRRRDRSRAGFGKCQPRADAPHGGQGQSSHCRVWGSANAY